MQINNSIIFNSVEINNSNLVNSIIGSNSIFEGSRSEIFLGDNSKSINNYKKYYTKSILY